jgi:hypothetical protein
MENMEFQKILDQHPSHKVELLLPEENEEGFGILLLPEAAYQITRYDLLCRIGGKTLIRHGEAMGDICRSYEEIKLLMRKQDYEKFLINLKGRGKGVLHTPSENIINEEEDGVFIFACWYLSDPRQEKLQALLLAYAPHVEGCFSTPYLVPIEPRTFDFASMFTQMMTEDNYGTN